MVFGSISNGCPLAFGEVILSVDHRTAETGGTSCSYDVGKFPGYNPEVSINQTNEFL
jgi:hypothetical protein